MERSYLRRCLLEIQMSVLCCSLQLCYICNVTCNHISNVQQSHQNQYLGQKLHSFVVLISSFVHQFWNCVTVYLKGVWMVHVFKLYQLTSDKKYKVSHWIGYANKGFFQNSAYMSDNVNVYFIYKPYNWVCVTLRWNAWFTVKANYRTEELNIWLNCP